jgi:DNA ligase D-like protein (predicted ligase)
LQCSTWYCVVRFSVELPSKVLPIPLIVPAFGLLSVLRPPSYFAQRRFVDRIEWAPVPKKSAPPKPPVAFIQTMDCLPVSELPEGEDWTYELKLDGYRLEVVRSSGKTTLYSRRQNILNKKFDYIADALDGLPGETVLDGELVAIGEDGKPNFNLLQNFRSARSRVVFYAFDILVHKGQSLIALALSERRRVLHESVKTNEHVAFSEVANLSATDMLKFVREHGLEGVVAKRSGSVYQPGMRTGLWSKYRINLGQEFVVGGYVPSNLGVDSLVVGFYRGKDLIYASRVRAGFVPATRREVFEKIKHLKTTICPFANLPEPTAGRWGQGLTAEKMEECIWLQPQAVARIDFLEWTGADHLRHTKFIALRDDKDPKKVVKEI